MGFRIFGEVGVVVMIDLVFVGIGIVDVIIGVGGMLVEV